MPAAASTSRPSERPTPWLASPAESQSVRFVGLQDAWVVWMWVGVGVEGIGGKGGGVNIPLRFLQVGK